MNNNEWMNRKLHFIVAVKCTQYYQLSFIKELNALWEYVQLEREADSWAAFSVVTGTDFYIAFEMTLL